MEIEKNRPKLPIRLSIKNSTSSFTKVKATEFAMDESFVQNRSVYWRRKHALILYGILDRTVRIKYGVYMFDITNKKWEELSIQNPVGQKPTGRLG